MKKINFIFIVSACLILLVSVVLIGCDSPLIPASDMREPGVNEDTKGPLLTGMTFTPTSINTSTEEATITFQCSVTDDLSGLRSINIGLERPDGVSVVFGSSVTLVSGTRNNGIFEISHRFNQHSNVGVWKIVSVQVTDEVSNSHFYGVNDLHYLNINSNISVNSINDVNAPLLSNLTFTPSAVDTTSGSATIAFQCTITDDYSGINSINIGLERPDGTSLIFGSSVTLVSGSIYDGIVEKSWLFRQYSMHGNWKVISVKLSDKVLNSRLYDATDLLNMGIDTDINVNSITDSEAPVLTGFSFTPSVINTTTEAQTITFQCSVTDNLSGIQSISIGFKRPDNESGSFMKHMTLVSGTMNNGVLENQWTLDQYSLLGEWHITSVHLYDKIYNSRIYDANELSSMGYDLIILNQS